MPSSSAADHQIAQENAGAQNAGAQNAAGEGLLFDLSGIDLSARAVTREGIGKLIPHRYEMALLDAVIWSTEDHSRAVGIKHNREDEFWVRGHFPERPMLPGVVMVETAAQLAAWMFNSRQPSPQLAAFLRLDNTVFRRSVSVGEDMIILCSEIKRGRRRFHCAAQGLVNGRVAFETEVTGMSLGDAKM